MIKVSFVHIDVKCTCDFMSVNKRQQYWKRIMPKSNRAEVTPAPKCKMLVSQKDEC